LSYFQEGKYAEARRAVERALSIAPDDPTVWSDYALVLYKSGDSAQALSFYD
jgi:Flp pilus assembly protein TadD